MGPTPPNHMQLRVTNMPSVEASPRQAARKREIIIHLLEVVIEFDLASLSLLVSHFLLALFYCIPDTSARC